MTGSGDDQSTQRELQQVREDYESLFNSLNDAVFIREVGGTFLRVNQTAIDRLGYSRAELLSMTPEDIAAEYDEQQGATQIREADQLVFENVHVTKHGERFPVEISATAITHRGRTAILSIARDITQRKAYEQRLQEERRRYSTLVEQSHDGIAITQDGVFEFVNPQMERLTGREASELLGLPFERIFTPEYRDLVTTRHDRRLAGENPPQRYDAQLETPDGERRDVEMQVSKLTYEGEPAILGTLKDITQRKAYERGLEQQNKRLDKFASMISHDLRNPLGIAETYIDFAEETGDPDDFAAVRDALGRMDEMIDDLLTMARAETTVEQTEAVDLETVVRNVATHLSGLAVRIDLPVGWEIEAHPELLTQIVENLLGNSLEHNDPPVTVRVGTPAESAGFYVADDGRGIPSQERDDVFEHGFTTTDDGTGFGLSIVAELVEAHGWEIDLTESATGGVRFTITGVSTTASG